MTKRSVLILPSSYPRPESPVDGVFIQDQAICLAKTYDVHVLAPRMVGWRDTWKGRTRPALTVDEDAGVTVWRPRHIQFFPKCFQVLGRSRSSAEFFAAWYEAAAQWGFQKFLREHGPPDLIHAHVVLPAGWVATRLGKRYGIPVVLTEHSGPFGVHMKTPWQRHRVKGVLEGVDRILAVSPALAKIMNALWPNVSIDVLGNVVRTDFFTPALAPRPSRSKLVFFLAALLVEEKGVQYALRALHALLRRNLRDLELVIGGDGPHRPVLEAMVRHLGLGAHCRFLGMLDRAGVRDQMQQCDVLVLPSLGETFGLVLGEAMACGKPVIATRCGGPEFVVTPRTGVLVAAANEDELADAMAEFALGKRPFNAGAIRTSVQGRFGEDAFVTNVTQVYETVWKASLSNAVTGAKARQSPEASWSPSR